MARSPRRANAEIRIVTFNVMIELLGHPDVPSWERRRQACVRALHTAGADTIGLQEVSPEQLAYVAASLPEFDVWTHVVRLPDELLAELRARYGAALPAEMTEVALLTRRETIRVQAQTHWWLSPTPDVELSMGFGKRVPRLAVSVRATHLPTGLPLTLATTHVDGSAPLPMTEVCLRKLAPDAGSGRSVMFFGDLNTHADPGGYQLMLAAGWRDAYAARSEGPDEVATWIGGGRYPPSRIDHVLYRSDRLTAVDWDVVTTRDRMRLSDHALVGATFVLDAREKSGEA
jgi:endonuclease/exonuclease/phosphatase family metal-dependent hydrolase